VHRQAADRWVIMNPGAGLTPDGPGVEHVPYVSSVSIRWNIRHPDGYLIEAGRATALVEGGLGEQDPAGREAGRADGR
jgi:hypothetical protein